MVPCPLGVLILSIIKRSSWTHVQEIAHTIIWESCLVPRLYDFAFFFFFLEISQVLGSHIIDRWFFILSVLLELFIMRLLWWVLSLVLVFFAAIVESYLLLATTSSILHFWLHGLVMGWWLAHYFKTCARELPFDCSTASVLAFLLSSSWALSWSTTSSWWQAARIHILRRRLAKNLV